MFNFELYQQASILKNGDNLYVEKPTIELVGNFSRTSVFLKDMKNKGILLRFSNIKSIPYTQVWYTDIDTYIRSKKEVLKNKRYGYVSTRSKYIKRDIDFVKYLRLFKEVDTEQEFIDFNDSKEMLITLLNLVKKGDVVIISDPTDFEDYDKDGSDIYKVFQIKGVKIQVVRP